MTTYTDSTQATDPTGAADSRLEFPAPPSSLTSLLSQPLSPQQKFVVPKAGWLRRLDAIPEAAEAIKALPTRINRDDAVDAVRQQWSTSITAAFVSSMVWAYGPKAGYAPFRVLRVLTACKSPAGEGLNPRVAAALERSVEIALGEGAAEGFSYLNDCTHKVRSHEREHADTLVGVDCGRIYGLGPSFFSKWLHAATLALHPEDRALPRKAARRPTESIPEHPPAPLWDSQAVSWLHDAARDVDQQIFTQEKERGPGLEYAGGWSPTTPEGDLLRLRVSRTDHYARYIELLEEWGSPHRLGASQVADRIYRLIRQDGDSTSKAA